MLLTCFFTACSNGDLKPVIPLVQDIPSDQEDALSDQLDKQSDHEVTLLAILSQMSEEECVKFIVENGVEIPEGFTDQPKFGGFVKNIIKIAEADPCYPISFNSDLTYAFAEAIRKAVCGYHGVSYSDTTPSTGSFTPSRSSSLTQNVLYAWEDNHIYFNCYAYAIDKTELPPNPSNTNPQHRIGDFAGVRWTPGMYVGDLVLLVQDDLEEINYNVSIAAQFAEPGPNEKLIAVRSAWFDYHFMKYNAYDEHWYHKPGNTSVLKHLSQQLLNNVGWIYEGVRSNGSVFHDPYYTYDGDIYYMTLTPKTFDNIADISNYLKGLYPNNENEPRWL